MNPKTFRYGPFAGGGVAEFFAAHGVALHDMPPEQRQSLRLDLEAQLMSNSGGNFIVTIGETRLVFEGPDEMGTLHHCLL